MKGEGDISVANVPDVDVRKRYIVRCDGRGPQPLDINPPIAQPCLPQIRGRMRSSPCYTMVDFLLLVLLLLPLDDEVQSTVRSSTTPDCGVTQKINGHTEDGTKSPEYTLVFPGLRSR